MKFIPMIALSLLAPGCTKEEKGTLTPVASIFTTRDLSPGTVNIISAEEIADVLASKTDLWVHSRSLALTNSSACLQEKIQALPITADKANISLVAEFDAAACFSSEEFGMDVTSAPLRFATWMGCQNEELEELNGKTLGELGNDVETKCASQGEQQLLTNMEFTIHANGEVMTETGVSAHVEYGVRSISATQTLEGGPCTLAAVGDGWLWQSACVTVDKTEVIQLDMGGKSMSDALTSDYLRLSYVDILESGETNASWYQSGRFDITLNNWTGTVSYNGATAAPSWTLQNGTEEETGTLALTPLKAAKLLPWAR